MADLDSAGLLVVELGEGVGFVHAHLHHSHVGDHRQHLLNGKQVMNVWELPDFTIQNYLI